MEVKTDEYFGLFSLKSHDFRLFATTEVQLKGKTMPPPKEGILEIVLTKCSNAGRDFKANHIGSLSFRTK